MASAARHRASLPVGVNPWSVEPFIVTSIDYIKRPEVLPPFSACRWDVVIVDEAHHAAIGSDRHDAVDALCRAAPNVMLLTATPHNGDAQAFASFVRTRSAQRPAPGISPNPSSKSAILANVEFTNCASDPAPRNVRCTRARRDSCVRFSVNPMAASATWLALSTLRKRALSSAFALQQSVERRLHALAADTTDTFQQLDATALRCGGRIPRRRRHARVDDSRASRLTPRARPFISRRSGRGPRYRP